MSKGDEWTDKALGSLGHIHITNCAWFPIHE